MVLMWFSPVWQSVLAVGQEDLESRIKDLCNKAIKAEGEELQTILSRLREALREQATRARDMVADQKRRTARS
jgi:hypothetical protein